MTDNNELRKSWKLGYFINYSFEMKGRTLHAVYCWSYTAHFGKCCMSYESCLLMKRLHKYCILNTALKVAYTAYTCTVHLTNFIISIVHAYCTHAAIFLIGHTRHVQLAHVPHECTEQQQIIWGHSRWWALVWRGKEIHTHTFLL